MYKQQRNYENLNKAIFDGIGPYGIPALHGGSFEADNWISFNFAKSCDEPERHGVHFFIDDYQFVRLWTNPDAYIPMLKRFQAVCTPDFSTYTDFPLAIQIYNHYRKHWLGAYWERNGVNVIPTISWSDEASFDWCFDGEPVGGTVAVSSVGIYGSIKDGIILHNHPKGGEPAFSDSDLISASMGREKGIVATSKNWDYIFQKNGGHFKAAAFVKAVKSAKIVGTDYNDAVDKWLKANAKKYGYTYSRKYHPSPKSK